MIDSTNQRLWTFYLADLRIRKLSHHTIANYLQTLNGLDKFLKAPFTDASKLDLMSYFADQQTRCAERTVHLRYVGINVFYNWMLKEELIPRSPVKGIPEPEIVDVAPVIPPDDSMKKLLKVCAGTNFTDRRDTAIFRMMAEPGGPRRAEILGMRIEDVNFEESLFEVLGKGGKRRVIPYGARTAQALMRYMVARTKHRYAASDVLWLGHLGPLKESSLIQILRRRCNAAGIRRINPHAIRHYSADKALASGDLSDLDIQTLFGWSSNKMLEVYARANRTQRAIASARKAGLGDKL